MDMLTGRKHLSDTHLSMLKLTGDEGNANEDHNEMSPILHHSQNKPQQTWRNQVLERRWSHGISSVLPVEYNRYNHSRVVRMRAHTIQPYLIKLRPSISPLGIKSRETLACAPRDTDKNVQSCTVLNSQNLEKTQVPMDQRMAK